MKWLFPIVLPLITAAMTSFVIDFGEEVKTWYTLNDGVMGGLSRGEVLFEEDHMVFEGKVSLENNGGFASVRSGWNEYDFENVKSIKIRYRSQGQNTVLTLETEKQWYLPYFKADLPISKKWKVVEINLEDFQAFQVGRKLDYKMTSDLMDEVIRIGIMTNDKASTAFKIEVDYLELIKE